MESAIKHSLNSKRQYWGEQCMEGSPIVVTDCQGGLTGRLQYSSLFNNELSQLRNTRQTVRNAYLMQKPP